MVSETGDITIEVTNGDFSSRGSTLMALGGRIGIDARDVRFETAAFENLAQRWSTSFSLTGISSYNPRRPRKPVMRQSTQPTARYGVKPPFSRQGLTASPSNWRVSCSSGWRHCAHKRRIKRCANTPSTVALSR